MEDLSVFLSKLINSERYGGRIIQADDSTVVLYDCGMWSDSHSHAVSDHFPGSEVRMMQSNSSLSGFVVIVKMHRGLVAYTWITAVLLVLSGMALTCRQMLGNV
jgi:hypothetical protein